MQISLHLPLFQRGRKHPAPFHKGGRILSAVAGGILGDFALTFCRFHGSHPPTDDPFSL